jgi:Pentapeptide repeats (8 copies)
MPMGAQSTREPLMQFWVFLSEIVRNDGLVIAGAIGIYLAWKRVVASNKQAEAQLRQAELARRDHVAELFNRAVGQLKDEKPEIRLGAVLILGQICTDFRDPSGPVIQLRTTYLKQEKVDYGETEPPADIGEIIRIIALVSQSPGRRQMNRLEKTESRPLRIDLRRTFIRRTDLADANLEGANLSYADCQNAIFRRVNFKNANLEETNLKGADLSDARNLTREQLAKAIIDDTTTLPAYLRSGR